MRNVNSGVRRAVALLVTTAVTSALAPAAQANVAPPAARSTAGTAVLAPPSATLVDKIKADLAAALQTAMSDSLARKILSTALSTSGEADALTLFAGDRR
jgi:hypothetical protein